MIESIAITIILIGGIGIVTVAAIIYGIVLIAFAPGDRPMAQKTLKGERKCIQE